MSEEWNKGQGIDREYYESYIKARYKDKLKRILPFKFLEDRFAPLMKIIIKYFTSEGRFSWLYAYQIMLLMHFTRVRMMNIPYFMLRNIENMALIVKKKPYP